MNLRAFLVLPVISFFFVGCGESTIFEADVPLEKDAHTLLAERNSESKPSPVPEDESPPPLVGVKSLSIPSILNATVKVSKDETNIERKIVVEVGYAEASFWKPARDDNIFEAIHFELSRQACVDPSLNGVKFGYNYRLGKLTNLEAVSEGTSVTTITVEDLGNDEPPMPYFIADCKYLLRAASTFEEEENPYFESSGWSLPLEIVPNISYVQ